MVRAQQSNNAMNAKGGTDVVFVKADEDWGKATEIRVVLNWFEELKRLAPTE